jgi:hypothetical protein
MVVIGSPLIAHNVQFRLHALVEQAQDYDAQRAAR